VSANRNFFLKATAKVLQEFELTKDFPRNFSKKYHIIYQYSDKQHDSIVVYWHSEDDLMM
jgi:hypothetical protein